MATFAAYFSYGGTDGLTHNEHSDSFGDIESAYLHLLRNRAKFAREKNANGVDFYVKSGGKRVQLNNPTRMRELMDIVRAEPNL
jgi:GT2 family glycosyltransferase